MSAEPQAEPWTVMRLLKWTTDFFKRRQFESARLDAEVLLATAMSCKRIELYTSYDKIPDDQVREAYRELVRRRGEGTPVAYLVGFREFYSMEITVDEHVLIPRPETEHVVIEVLDQAKRLKERQSLLIADVGTGSGAIAVAVAKHQPKAKVYAIDISPDALRVAEKNIEKHQLKDRITTLQSDLFARVDPSLRFDFIASNPPYVTEAEYAELSREVRDHEPRGALVGGVKGTEVIEKLLQQSLQRLTPGGRLVIELSPMIAAQVRELIAAHDQYHDLRMIKDLAGHVRVASVAFNG